MDISSLLRLLLAISLLSGASATCHPDDEEGLLGFKSAITADPSGMLSSWKPGTDCCRWAGVECRENNRVTTLSIYGRSGDPKAILAGTVSPSIAKIRYLDGLYLMDLRNLTGPIPAALFQLPSLTYVYIENSRLQSVLPASVGLPSKLYAFSLVGNALVGQIPASISNLTELRQLKLGGNLFSGRVPSGIGRLKKLTYLSLKKNLLTGPLPDLSSLTELRTLELSHNSFSGPLPPSIAALSQNLAYLELGSNSFTGPIPEFLSKFQALDTLDLSHNQFTGTVPKSFKNLTKIFNLDLSFNALVDPFPELSVEGIESLDLSYNRFHLRSIPKWVASSPIIYSLKLASCGIKMKLDNWKPSETYYYDYIDLSENQISGSPVSLVNSTEYLKSFKMNGNQLKFDMKGLKLPATLEELELARNQIFGSIPASVSKLQKLALSNNQLCGPIPPTKFPPETFADNKCLCGSPLPPCRKKVGDASN